MVRRLLLPSSSPYLVKDTDGVLSRYGVLWAMQPPVLSEFSWVNQGASGASDANGSVYLSAAPGANPNLRALVKAQPAKPYKIVARFAMHSRVVGQQFAGLCWRDSAGGGLVTVHLTNNLTFVTGRYNSPTALNSNYFSAALSNYVVNAPIWFQLEDDGTNRMVSLSADRFNWLPIHTVSNTDFITADQVGFFASPATGVLPTAIWMQHWEES